MGWNGTVGKGMKFPQRQQCTHGPFCIVQEGPHNFFKVDLGETHLDTGRSSIKVNWKAVGSRFCSWEPHSLI